MPIFWFGVIFISLVAIIGVIATLWWWKLADRWVEAEDRRFKPKVDEREEKTVIIRNPGELAAGDSSDDISRDDAGEE